jgi:L,D-peptidoglycan transpeptidase YkuD (ErfK/YbiS/YcfS/YnhG family)
VAGAHDKRYDMAGRDKKSLPIRRIRGSRPIVVRPAPGRPQQGLLLVGGRLCRAALGRSGIVAVKREGDGATPMGRFAMRQVLYRADRGARPHTSLPLRAIRGIDGWCEDPRDPNYNRLVKLTPRHQSDRLTRDDQLYDLIVVLGYNDVPRVRGRGSAIFVHLARDGYTPTAGCIGLSRHDLLMLLAHAKPGSPILVTR